MAHTKEHKPILVQAYDYSQVREYRKKYSGLIFSHTETIHTETLENSIDVEITGDKLPDRIFFNGQELKFEVAVINAVNSSKKDEDN